MRVKPRKLEGAPLVGLVALESYPDLEVLAGETIGYYCLECGQSDETLEQIIHEEGCSLCGRHGRRCYGSHPVEAGPLDHASKGELQPETCFSVVRWGWTDTDLGIYDSSVVGFRCDECHSMDEHLFEMVHDSTCQLSGTAADATTQRARHAD